MPMSSRRIHSASVILLPAIFVFSFFLWGIHPVHERHLSGTPVDKQSNRFKAPFVMQDAQFHFFLGSENHSRVRVESVSVRSQRMGDIVFDSFKEVVLHNVRVTAKTGGIDEAMDWVADSNLPLLAAPFLVGTVHANSFLDFGTNIVAENLNVYLESADGSRASHVLSAARMIRTLIPDEILFQGDFQLNRSPDQTLRSTKEARWSMKNGVLQFPEEYSLNGQPRINGSIMLGHCRFEPLEAAEGSLSNGDAGAGGQVLKLGMGDRSSLLPLEKLRRVHRDAKGKRRREMISAVWQFLALHPDALSKTGAAQMMLVGPDFKLGAFEPGPLFDASPAWMNSGDATEQRDERDLP